MSKKKVFSGSTMTLKDFHGGSIPSDVSLPSAPGLIVRPTDRPVFDRQNVWGNSIGAGRSDHRLRPRSSSSVRNLDDSKTPFLSSSVIIGRNFDEDERKPLGGGGPPPPHRTVSDESFGGSAMLLEPRVDNRKISVQSNLGPVGAQIGGISESSYSSRVVEGGQSGVGVSSRPNVWGARKEVNRVGEVVSSTRSRQSLVSEFAQASALDKISSGRWQTKPVQNMVEVEVIRPLESPNSFYGWEKDSYVDGGVSFLSKRCLGIEVNRGSFNAMHSGGERVHSPAQNSVLFTNEGKPASPDATFGASELPQPPEVSERPKLKLLPRTKPLEVEEAPVVVHSQACLGSQQQIDTIHSEAASVFENPRHVIARPSSSEATHRKPGVSGSEAEQRAVERPKLNLKPRSQPVNHSDESTEIERKALFGGARPREMVLKERGVDDVVTSYDKAQAPSRIKNNAPRSEVIPAHPNTSHQSERVNNLSIDQRIGRGHEKRDQRGILHRFDLQRKNWHNDNRRDGRDTEKHQQERQPSPETWRKPVEPPNSYNSGLRFGKAVSAVDLVQAFSRSVSSPKPVDQFSSQNGLSGQKGLPACSLVPFSRLTGPTSRAQINGY